MPHTREDFFSLMKTFEVPVEKFCVLINIDKDGCLQSHHSDLSKLFTGTDYLGRHFINIPVRAVYANGVCVFKYILIYQKKPDTNNFKVSARLPKTETFNMLLRRSPLQVAQELDFLNLAILLAGRSVEIYKRKLVEPKGSPVYDDPDSYVTLSLYDSSTLPI